MLARHNIFPDVRKIAVLRANALGDLMFALPALEALRVAYPDAEIVLLAKKWHTAFLAGRPSPVDRVVAVPLYNGVSGSTDEMVQEDSEELERFFAAMRREQFDLGVQIHGGGRNSNPFLLRCGPRFTVGARTPDAAMLDRWIPYIFYQSEIFRYLETVALAGAVPVVLEPRLSVIAQDREEAARIVHPTDQPLVALHPGAGDPRRHWPTEKFAAVGDALVAAGARVVVTGTEAERYLVEAVVHAMQADAINLCERLTLGGLAGLLERCSVVVSNDSGPVHLAGAVGTPTVGIYWCGNLITAGPPTRARHHPLISWRLDCPVCGRNCTRESCTHRESFVADVAVEDVIAAAREFLDHTAQPIAERLA